MHWTSSACVHATDNIAFTGCSYDCQTGAADKTAYPMYFNSKAPGAPGTRANSSALARMGMVGGHNLIMGGVRIGQVRTAHEVCHLPVAVKSFAKTGPPMYCMPPTNNEADLDRAPWGMPSNFTKVAQAAGAASMEAATSYAARVSAGAAVDTAPAGQANPLIPDVFAAAPPEWATEPTWFSFVTAKVRPEARASCGWFVLLHNRHACCAISSSAYL